MLKHKKRGPVNLAFVSFSLILISLGFFILKPHPTPTTQVLSASYDADDEILFWEKFINKNPTYVDGLVRLSLLEARRGNTNKAAVYWLSAHNLSPNSKSVNEAKKSLGF
ncbi:hypothetical protein A2V56_01250 [Candidatus Woesebacteria bacterium RBG_19FT_COMBO_42_9]|uniref:Uncharacterized protein n=1 Tax=Candidatus Woesebacteria bacterium RBG_16_42_24 TaxID=1802485 RepID=A0A1F7XLC5_9BACT|nr:MAG: hypothetical protein A2V97_03565 [Candidatus Woesebacteria bacterium RBG_16_42_24]OGM17642.1 MAG: hypothetical protein A2V56_01250 [Candidatus Woesebacteria bacterium RBG_19FT_COMBO_42_9]OGM68257.1 MAG: hypothetical protein A2985_04460 [Candidatus Woesebacteria bacterium RIFCSPLOWO2_01_FULL_43_11]